MEIIAQSESLTLDMLARMADLPRDEQRRIAVALGPDGLEHAMRVYARAMSGQGVQGLGKSIFSKIGDFLGDAAKVVGNVVTGGAFQEAQPVVVQVPTQPPPAKPETPAWLVLALIGGGALVLALLLRPRA